MNCPNCGLSCAEDWSYCPDCRTSLQPVAEEELLDGIKVVDWHMFIGENSSRYVEIFSRNKGKRLFLHMNWAAMLFSFYWMFYRKMYKYAFLFLAVSILFSVVLTSVVAMALKPAVLEAREILEPYTYTSYYDSEALEAHTAYNQAIATINGRLVFWTLVPSLSFHTLFALLADCLYRSHIRRTIACTDGGTSVWSMVGGIVVYQLITRLVATPLISYIAATLLE